MGRRLTALLAVLVMLLLAACQGKPLPGGMEETALLDAGQEALLLLAGGDYGGVYGLLREDVAEALTAEDIRDLALRHRPRRRRHGLRHRHPDPGGDPETPRQSGKCGAGQGHARGTCRVTAETSPSAPPFLEIAHAPRDETDRRPDPRPRLLPLGAARPSTWPRR